MRKLPRKAHLSDAALGMALLILAIQLYLFETVLGSVLDGKRALLPGSFFVSLALTSVALLLAFKATRLDQDDEDR
jgi:predicted Co/Zn/Cd cation transporter (cation efflux family)